MNSNAGGTQTWSVMALGGPLDVSAFARSVNPFDPETVVIEVFDSFGARVGTSAASYPPGQPPGTEVPAAVPTILATSGSIYRIVIATPFTPNTQSHYRLRAYGAETISTSSPSSPSFEEGAVRWRFHVAPGEPLSVTVSTLNTPATATTLTYRWIDPAGAVSASGAVLVPDQAHPQALGVASPAGGTWTLDIVDATDHYTLDKTVGADRGIYLDWASAGEAGLTGTITLDGVPNTVPVTIEIRDAVTGDLAASIGGVTDTFNGGKLRAGDYVIHVVVPPGIAPVPDIPVRLVCDEVKSIKIALKSGDRTLTVKTIGSGSGSVTSAAPGINCGPDCTEPYPHGATVELVATADEGSAVVGLTGGCTSGLGLTTCTATMDADQTVTVNFEALPTATITVAWSTVTERDSGTFGDPFTIWLSSPSSVPVYIDFSTAAGTSTGCAAFSVGCDHQNVSARVVFSPGVTSQIVDGIVYGDTVPEVDETFEGTLAGSWATVGGTWGIQPGSPSSAPVTIVDDDYPTVSFATNLFGSRDRSTIEGSTGSYSTHVPLEVVLSAPYPQPITVTYNTADLTATAGADYTHAAGTLTFDPGETSKTIFIDVNAEYAVESDEDLRANLITATNATIAAGAAMVTIINDDALHALAVSKQGTGGGSVTSLPAGINCGLVCARDYEFGTDLTLIATPDATSTFAGWAGACTGTGTCTVTMDAAKTVTATFTRRYDVTIGPLLGTGGGTVSSDPVGVTCAPLGGGCAGTFDFGTLVTLTASPAAGSVFAGWGGACSSANGEIELLFGKCTFTVTGPQEISATFNKEPVSLAVNVLGTGTATVTSSPAGIDCPVGLGCSHAFDYGTAVTMTANAAEGTTFMGWSGAGLPLACAVGTPATCTVTLAAARVVNATFAVKEYLVMVRGGYGSGQGTITSDDGWITANDCLYPSCSRSYPHGTSITLTGTPSDAQSSLTKWQVNGSDFAGPGALNLVIREYTLVDVYWDATYTLTVARAGTGSGTVTDDVRTITCGSDCTRTNTDAGDYVTLSATPDSGSVFAGWSSAPLGACSGTTNRCDFTWGKYDQEVTATFTALPTLSITKTVSLTEGDTGTKTALFVVSIPTPSSVDITFDYATADGTATDGSDYNGGSGTGLVLPAGATTYSFSVQVYGDTLVESDETFTLTISNSNAPLGNAVGTATIINDDDYPTVSFATNLLGSRDRSTLEGSTGTYSTHVPLEIVLSAPYPRPVTVTYNTADVTATAGADYTHAAGTLTFDPGETSKTVFLDINAEYFFESDEELRANLVIATNATIAGGAALVTIINDDALHALAVSRQGTGGGNVTSLPAGIDCGLVCAQDYDFGTAVTLTAAAASGSTFAGWAGACTGTGACVVTMDAAKSVTATFALEQSTPGKMEGEGALTGPGGPLRFHFTVRERRNGIDGGRLQVRLGHQRPSRFESTEVTAVTFSDDPAFLPGRRPRPTIDTVVFTGAGRWNDEDGYTFEVRATDRGEPWRDDTCSIVIRSPLGVVVASVDGRLESGNIQSERMNPRRN